LGTQVPDERDTAVEQYPCLHRQAPPTQSASPRELLHPKMKHVPPVSEKQRGRSKGIDGSESALLTQVPVL